MDSTPTSITNKAVAEILPDKDSLLQLLNSRKIRVYLGIDPTGSTLTLGHAVVLRKLQQFVEAGHTVILVIGNATVRIGDPTGRDKTRPALTDEQILKHFEGWKEQASCIIDFSKIEVRTNGDWLDPLSLPEFIKLMSNTTVQQLLERDMFQERLKNNLPIFTHELMYPLLQGYDSVELEVDLEVGGTDQTFNMLVGRSLLKQYKNRDKWVLTVPLLVGTDGRKMGKSLNNFIALAAPAKQQFFQLMQVNDEVMFQYLELLTDLTSEELQTRRDQLAAGELHPMEIKKEMAFLIVSWTHSEEDAKQARSAFEAEVQGGELSGDIPTMNVPKSCLVKELVTLTHGKSAGVSSSEVVRLIQQGAVKLADTQLKDPFASIDIETGVVLRVGKKHAYILNSI